MNQKLVMFDFADTIAKLSPSKEELLQSYISSELDIEISLEKISETYHYVTNLVFYSSVKIQDLKDKKNFYDDFNQNIVSLLGLAHLMDTSKLFDYFKEHGQHWILKSGVKNLLEELKAEGCLISLVSNFDTRLYAVLEKMDIIENFDSIFVSQEVGLEKPNREFFKLPLQKHDIESKNSYFIGDSYLLDYLPCDSIGINAILLDENDRYVSANSLVKIKHLEDCKKVIYKQNV